MNFSTFASHFSPKRFWKGVHRHAQAIGYDVLEKALWLYYTALAPSTPAWAKTTIYGALGYLVLPTRCRMSSRPSALATTPG